VVKAVAIRCHFGSAKASPSHSRKKPFANRYPPFAVVSGSVEDRTPLISPTKVGARFLRHQLWVKARSVKFHDLRHK